MTQYRKTPEALARLSPEQYRVTQESGTEMPGTGAFVRHFAPGLYVDVVSGEPLFASADKFGVMETLMNALREAHVSSVFVEHDMEMVKLYATRVAVWAQGIIQMTGEPEVVLNDPDVIRNVIGN